MTEVLPNVLVLAMMAAVALWLTISRGGVTASAATLQPAVWVAAIAIAAQAGHFGEELMTGLHERLPAAFGLPPIASRPPSACRRCRRVSSSRSTWRGWASGR